MYSKDHSEFNEKIVSIPRKKSLSHYNGSSDNEINPRHNCHILLTLE